jgi:hypothetical protein
MVLVNMGLLLNSQNQSKPLLNQVEYNALLNGETIFPDSVSTDSFSMHYNTNVVSSSATLSIPIGLHGSYQVDWGDGTVEDFVTTVTTIVSRQHTYAVSDDDYVVTIKNTGVTDWAVNTFIRFKNVKGFTQIGDNGKNSCLTVLLPDSWRTGNVSKTWLFSDMFKDDTGLTGEIPANLFGRDSHAQPVDYMFDSAFSGCSGLTGSIPAGLFDGISGTTKTHLFNSVFNGCSGLTGAIPAGLFDKITGSPTPYLWYAVFYGCSGLTGSIPAGLFANVAGIGKLSTYFASFRGCSNLTSIADPLLGAVTIDGTATSVFSYMFYQCTKLTGESAKMSNGSKLYTVANNASYSQATYQGCIGLSDWGSIPSAWK